MPLESAVFWTSCSPHTLTETKRRRGLKKTECLDATNGLFDSYSDFAFRLTWKATRFSTVVATFACHCVYCDQNSLSGSPICKRVEEYFYFFAAIPGYKCVCFTAHVCINQNTLYIGLFNMYIRKQMQIFNRNV